MSELLDTLREHEKLLGRFNGTTIKSSRVSSSDSSERRYWILETPTKSGDPAIDLMVDKSQEFANTVRLRDRSQYLAKPIPPFLTALPDDSKAVVQIYKQHCGRRNSGTQRMLSDSVRLLSQAGQDGVRICPYVSSYNEKKGCWNFVLIGVKTRATIRDWAEIMLRTITGKEEGRAEDVDDGKVRKVLKYSLEKNTNMSFGQVADALGTDAMADELAFSTPEGFDRKCIFRFTLPALDLEQAELSCEHSIVLSGGRTQLIRALWHLQPDDDLLDLGDCEKCHAHSSRVSSLVRRCGCHVPVPFLPHDKQWPACTCGVRLNAYEVMITSGVKTLLGLSRDADTAESGFVGVQAAKYIRVAREAELAEALELMQKCTEVVDLRGTRLRDHRLAQAVSSNGVALRLLNLG